MISLNAETAVMPSSFGSLVSLLAMALAGCTTVPTDPGRFNLEPLAVSHLRSPQTLALVNTYAAPTVVQIDNRAGWSTDLKELTDTAAAMLRQAMEKRGITVAPESNKKVSLRILQAAARMAGLMTTARVQLVAQFGDETRTIVVGENTGFSGERALDGALLFALNQLVNDEKFVAYLNRDSHLVCLIEDTYMVGERILVGYRIAKIGRVIGASELCRNSERSMAAEVIIVEGEEKAASFSVCTRRGVQVGGKLTIGPASNTRSATIERVLGPSPRCADPHRYPTRVEARFELVPEKGEK